MKIAIVGATGKFGSRIAAEAAARGHAVVAISRRPAARQLGSDITPFAADVTDTQALARAFAGCDAVVHAYRPDITSDTRYEQQKTGTGSVLAALKLAGVPRILAVGGAGSLIHEGVVFKHHPAFPKDWATGAVVTYLVKEMLESEPGLRWTFLCPPNMVAPGARTGVFRLGLDDMIVAADGTSTISLEDYAVAMVDELEVPRHDNRRFTVGY
ncbi:NAD(P)-dependent oxidoreductase [uncultured Alsobacter sp.]|uniref:NAD(P)-dependent oxidoreductase n=1 Tax=uncultured Alsobacter sp. TaxID=1748258 RepID=UPI0025FBE213|nr:NAD(P)H-binding protein [uncultured Alsobacter sp.]